MPDKSPRKPSAKKVPDKSLKEKRQDKKDKKDGHAGFGAISAAGACACTVAVRIMPATRPVERANNFFMWMQFG